MNRFYTLVSVSIVAACAQSVCAHFDFIPGISNNQIVTSGSDDETGDLIDPLIVNGYDFGELAADPYNIGDPGFNTNGPSAFTSGSSLRMTGLPVAGRYLSYWDGTDAVDFGSPASGTSLVLSGSPTRFATFVEGSVSYAPVSTTSLLIASFGSSGTMHDHLTSSILLNGMQEPDSIPTGAYLLSFSLSNPDTGVMDSDPLFLVYNNGLDEELHDMAMDYVASTYVPEPTILALSSFGMILLARRR